MDRYLNNRNGVLLFWNHPVSCDYVFFVILSMRYYKKSENMEASLRYVAVVFCSVIFCLRNSNVQSFNYAVVVFFAGVFLCYF